MTVADDLAAYRTTLLQMHEHRVDADGKPRAWNRLFDKVQSLQLVLRQSPEGRAGITQLAVSDDCATVRQTAASHALFWDTPKARPVLEALAQERGLASLTARTTLQEFDAGRLDMTWVPKRG